MKAFIVPSRDSYVFSKTRIRQFIIYLSIFLLLWVGSVSISLAQFQKPDIGMPTPNAASIGLYGEVPVSLYTGTPNIDIPIYTIDEGKIKVPISLSYHASGVRVNQHPGWVGLNWNLNAGGAITRVVKGYHDETAYTAWLSSPENSYRHLGYYYKSPYLNSSNWDTKEFMKTLFDQNMSTAPPGQFSKLYADLQPDEFNFNFLGYSGKFYRDYDGSWVVGSETSMKVQLLANQFTKPGSELKYGEDEVTSNYFFYSYNGFIITTPDGTKYEFGGITSAIEFSLPFFVDNSKDLSSSSAPGAGWMADTWYLKKITTTEGKIVEFNYEIAPLKEGKFIASFYRSLANKTTSGSGRIRGILGAGVSYQCESYNTAYLDSTNHYNGTLQRPTYLKEIKFQKGKVIFDTETTNELPYKPHVFSAKYWTLQNNQAEPLTGSLPVAYKYYLTGGDLTEMQNKFFCFNCGFYSVRAELANNIVGNLKWRKLKAITIQANDAIATNKFSFDYVDNPNSRLYLTAINKISTIDANCKELYKFSYHHDTNNPLPDYVDKADQTDHWGFFNKNTYNLNSFPTNYENHKNASNQLAVLQEGTLSKIEFPTGGTSEFEYEPHDAYKYQKFNLDGSVTLDNSTSSVGGIRIKKIKSNDGTQVKTKEYEYKFVDGTEKSSGILNGKPQYIYDVTLKVDEMTGATGTYSAHYVSSQNTLPLSANSSGSHIGYRQVKEKFGDGSYKVHQFTNYESSDGLHLDEAITSNQRIGDGASLYEEKNSLALERGKLLSESYYSKDNLLVSKRNFTYQRYNSRFARGLSANLFAICGDERIKVVQAYAYKNYTFQYFPQKIENYSYDQADNAKFTLDLVTYNYNGLGLQSEASNTRSGKTIRTVNKYVYDYATTTGSDEASQSILSMKSLGMDGVLVEQQIWNNENGTDAMASGNVNLFRRYNAASGYNNVQVERVYSFANPASQTVVPLSLITSGLFKYNSGYTNLVVDFGSDNANGYTPNGEPKRYQGRDGVWNYFSWYDGNKIGLLQSKTIGNQTTTYDYKPLVGVISIKDPASFNTFYAYDGFNRLVTVKDHWNNLLESNSYNLINSSGCSTPKLVSEALITPTLSGSESRCTANLVKLLWRNSDGNRLAGATIQGSQNGVDWEVLYQFPTTAVAPVGSYVTQSFNNPNKYPHIRYNARANDGVGDLKEIRFYYVANGIEYPLTGTGFGSEPNLAGQGWANALDGNESTQWHAQYVAPLGHAGNSNFVGISLPCATTLITPILYKSTNGDVCASDSPITLTASGFSGQLEWYLNDVLITTDPGQTQYTATIAGTYKVRSKSNNSYSGFSNTIVLNQKSGCDPTNGNQCTANLVKLLWRNSDGNRLAGATIQGSQTGADWEVLYQFPTTAVAPVGSYVTQSFNNPNKYPHIRYNARANDGVGDLKEIRFYYVANGIEYPLTGTGFGSEPNLAGQGWANALDGNESTQWHAQYVAPLGHAGNSNFVGISLPCATTLITPILYKSTNGDVCASDSPITLTASGFSGQLEWYLNDVLITTDPGQTQYTATIAGTYKVRSKSNNSYSGFSNIIVLNQKSGCAPPNYSRVVIVGNSITKLIAQTGSDGWQSPALSAAGGWGRASSTQAKDFAHILEARFRGLDPNAQVLPLWEAPFERDYVSSSHAGWVTYDFTALQNRIKNSFGSSSWKPDLVIIRLGENVLNSEVDLNNFKGGYNTLINKVLEVSAPGAKVILTNSMWADQPKANEKIQQVATERGLPFVDLSDMISNPVYLAGNDPVSMAAFPNNTGDKHPGDAGMLEIADRIWSKVRNVNLPSNIGGNITKVRLSPRTECCMDRIKGSVIQGSNDISNANGWTTLAEIIDTPVAGWNEYAIRTTTSWRYVRFLAGTNCYGELKELEFYNGNVKLTGTKFGSPAAYNNDPVNFGYAVAFDGLVTNSWHGTAPGPQNYAGLDLGASCPSPTASVLSPANNASVVGTASPGTPGNVITAISVTTCVPSGTSITRVEIWAKTAEGLWPNKMGNAIVDASQPGVYKLLAQEGSADGKWLAGYLAPGTYRFWAKLITTTGTFESEAAYNLITITAPPVTGCPTPTASVLSPANNASVVGTASPGTPGNVITAISVTTCVPSGTSITRVEIWAKTAEGLWPNKMGNAIVDASQPGVYKLLAQEGSADGKWLAGYLAPGTYRFWAKLITTTGTFESEAAYNLITITAPPVTGCPTPTASVLSPANNASVVGTASPGTPGNVITAISVTTCVPSGTSITRVEIWAKTAEGLWPNKMGNAIVDASQPGVYKLLAQEGSADGKWLAGYLAPGTYRFWAKLITTTGTFESEAAYNLITITAPPVTGCPTPTASVLSPANNASVVGTASPGTPGNVITAISVTTCVPSGTSITRVEIWAKTAEGLWPNKMGNAIVDASQPGVYKLLAQEGSADGKWLAGYLAPGTYRFWAKLITTTGTFESEAAYNLITITAPPVTGCPTPTASVLSPANNASVVGTASPGTPGNVITAISVTTCVPSGTSITRVEIWAKTAEGLWPNKMGNAIVDASQPGVYKLLAQEGSADGKWLAGYLAPGTYRFWAKLITTTGTFESEAAYNLITITAP